MVNSMTPYLALQSQLKAVIGTLPEREGAVLTARFGLAGEPSMTLEDVGKRFNIRRERIRQIEAKALRKLRHPSRMRKLEGFISMS